MDPNDEIGSNHTKEQRRAIEGIYQNLRKRVREEETKLRQSKIPALFKKSAAILRTMAEAVFDLYAYYMGLQKRMDEMEAKLEFLMDTKVIGGTMRQRMSKRQKKLAKVEAEEAAKKKAEEAVQDKAAQLEAERLLAAGYSPEPHKDCKYVEGQVHCGHCVKGAAEVEKRDKPDLKIVEPEGEQSKEG